MLIAREFHIFDRSLIISSQGIPTTAILRIFIRKIKQVHHFGRGKGVDEESNKKWHRKDDVQSKKWCPSHKFFYVFFAVTKSFLLGFWCSSDNITASDKKSTSKKEPTSLFEITM